VTLGKKRGKVDPREGLKSSDEDRWMASALETMGPERLMLRRKEKKRGGKPTFYNAKRGVFTISQGKKGHGRESTRDGERRGGEKLVKDVHQAGSERRRKSR